MENMTVQSCSKFMQMKGSAVRMSVTEAKTTRSYIVSTMQKPDLDCFCLAAMMKFFDCQVICPFFKGGQLLGT